MEECCPRGLGLRLRIRVDVEGFQDGQDRVFDVGSTPAVTPTMQGDLSLGFGSTHHPKTSLAYG